jgi:hypothetical protein
MIDLPMQMKLKKEAVGYGPCKDGGNCEHCGHAFRNVFGKMAHLHCDIIGVQNVAEAIVDGSYRCRMMKLSTKR